MSKGSAGGYFRTTFTCPMRSHRPASRECEKWHGLRAFEEQCMLSDGRDLLRGLAGMKCDPLLLQQNEGQGRD